MSDIFNDISSETLNPHEYKHSIIVLFLSDDLYLDLWIFIILSTSSIDRISGIFEPIFGDLICLHGCDDILVFKYSKN